MVEVPKKEACDDTIEIISHAEEYDSGKEPVVTRRFRQGGLCPRLFGIGV